MDKIFPATDRDLLEAGAAFVGGQVTPERRLQIADVLFRSSLWVNKENPDALSNLATLAIQRGRYDEARALAVQSVALSPAKWAYWAVLGQAYGKLGQFLEAKQCIQRAIELDSKQPSIWFILAGLQEILGDYQKCEECYKQALLLNPADHQTKFSWGIIKMLRGDYSYGLPLYESRLEYYTSKYPVGKTAQIARDIQSGDITYLAVEAEQGIGDLFQMARYVSILKKHVKIVDLHCEDSLTGIMSRFEFDHIVGYSQPWNPSTRTSVSGMSLPYLITLLGEDIFQPPANINLNGLKPKSGTVPLIGLCRKGNPEHPNDRFRSIPEEVFKPLLKYVKGVVSSYDLSLKNGWENTIQDVSECDLVITVDTAIGHLAGTLGRPTWLLLAAVPDWRWGDGLIGKETTPWYPSVQILRQEQPLQWGPVIDRVIKKLGEIYDR